MLGGGFDVVIGNPPYINRRKISTYQFGPYPCSGAPDIYAPCAYRAHQLQNKAGSYGMVLPLSITFGTEYKDLRDALTGQNRNYHVASFGYVPDALFRGVHLRITLNFTLPAKSSKTFVTGLNRWTQEARPALLPLLRFGESVSTESGRLHKVDGPFGNALWSGLGKSYPKVSLGNNDDAVLYAKNVVGYWFPATLRPLRCLDFDGNPATTTAEMQEWQFRDTENRDAVFSILASRLGFILHQFVSDDFNIAKWNLQELPINVTGNKKLLASLAGQAAVVMQKLENTPEGHTWRKMLGMWVEGLDTRAISSTTDQIILELLESIGLANRWDEWEAIYWRSMKSTGEAAHTKRGTLPPGVSA